MTLANGSMLFLFIPNLKCTVKYFFTIYDKFRILFLHNKLNYLKLFFGNMNVSVIVGVKAKY